MAVAQFQQNVPIVIVSGAHAGNCRNSAHFPQWGKLPMPAAALWNNEGRAMTPCLMSSESDGCV